MEWIVKIEEEKNQRIRIKFYPQFERIIFFGEARVENNKWSIFCKTSHEMKITLEQIQGKMEEVIVLMRKRLKEYENLNKGFSVLKWIAFQEDED